MKIDLEKLEELFRLENKDAKTLTLFERAISAVKIIASEYPDCICACNAHEGLVALLKPVLDWFPKEEDTHETALAIQNFRDAARAALKKAEEV